MDLAGVDLKIPAGVQSGEIIRLRGKGAPHLQSSGPASTHSELWRGKRGDHLVTIVVKTPRKLSKKAKRLLEEMKEEGV